MYKSKDELAKKENELSLAKQEEMEKKQEKTKLLEKIKSEEDDLKKKLEMAQKKLRYFFHNFPQNFINLCNKNFPEIPDFEMKPSPCSLGEKCNC